MRKDDPKFKFKALRVGGNRGFTLIEAVIAVIVLGLALGLLIPFAVSLRNSAAPTLAEQQVLLVQEELEQVIADRQDTTTPRGFIYATTPANYPAENPIVGVTGFSRSVAIVCVTSANPNGAGTAPNPSCAVSDGRTDYGRVTVTVSNAYVGAITAVTLLANH